MDTLKLELAKIGLMISWLGAGTLGLVCAVNFCFLNMAWFPMWMEIILGIIALLLFCLQYPCMRARNKYRDIVEYDENGISRVYGNFSTLSNQERAEIEKQKMLKREMLIDSATLNNITKKGSSNPEIELENLVGLQNIKDEMHKMASKLAFEREVNRDKKKKKKNSTPEKADSTYHMVFLGNAGCGKTETARIMSGFLYKYGIIQKNQYIEVDGNFFNGNSYGESTEKIKFIIGQARGGVLFIDEAYAMLNSMESQEVIATLIAELENKRGDLVVILAGYEKEMTALINSNTGFQSRIKYFFHFENYKMDELWQIFIKMANSKGFAVVDDLKKNFTSHMLEEMRKPNYGNARSVRNVLDRALDNHALNYMDKHISKELKMTLLPQDLPTYERVTVETVNADEL